MGITPGKGHPPDCWDTELTSIEGKYYAGGFPKFLQDWNGHRDAIRNKLDGMKTHFHGRFHTMKGKFQQLKVKCLRLADSTGNDFPAAKVEEIKALLEAYQADPTNLAKRNAAKAKIDALI